MRLWPRLCAPDPTGELTMLPILLSQLGRRVLPWHLRRFDLASSALVTRPLDALIPYFYN